MSAFGIIGVKEEGVVEAEVVGKLSEMLDSRRGIADSRSVVIISTPWSSSSAS